MLCSKFEQIPTSIFQVMAFLRKCQKSDKIPVLQPKGFPKKWLRNYPKFLLHFLIPYPLYAYMCTYDFNQNWINRNF